MCRPVLFRTPSVRRTASVFPKITVHCPIEALIITLESHFLSHIEHLIKEMVIFSLDSCSFLFKILISQGTVVLVLVPYWWLGKALRGCRLQNLILVFITTSISGVIIYQLLIDYLVCPDRRHSHSSSSCTYERYSKVNGSSNLLNGAFRSVLYCSLWPSSIDLLFRRSFGHHFFICSRPHGALKSLIYNIIRVLSNRTLLLIREVIVGFMNKSGHIRAIWSYWLVDVRPRTIRHS